MNMHFMELVKEFKYWSCKAEDKDNIKVYTSSRSDGWSITVYIMENDVTIHINLHSKFAGQYSLEGRVVNLIPLIKYLAEQVK